DRIDIENVQLARELDDVERANLDRKIDDKALALALGQQGRQNLAVIGLGQRGLKIVDPAHVEQMPMGLGGVDDGEAALVELEMPLEQRQNAPANGAKADQNDRAGDFAMNGPVRHLGGLLGELEMVQRVKSREGCFNQVGEVFCRERAD